MALWCLDTYFRTRKDVGIPAMFCRKDLAGHFAVDARTLAAGKEKVLYMLMRQRNRRASERGCCHAAPASCDEWPKALSRHYPRRKILTPKAAYA